MNCPKCRYKETQVVDSRPTEDGTKVRRRRECTECGTRFTTYEEPAWEGLQVEKRGGELEPFERTKLLAGILRAIEKRPITEKEAEEIADNIEKKLMSQSTSVVSSEDIGELVMNRLKELDEVAYMRFVSVHKEFSDPSQFVQELDKIEEDT